MPYAELSAGQVWLSNMLSVNSVIQGLVGNPARVYAENVPSGGTYPCIVIKLQAAQQDTEAMGAQRVLATADFIVEAVGAGVNVDFAPLEPIAGKLDALIQGQGGPVTSGTVMMCHRLRAWRYRERDDQGTHYSHLGGVYRLLIQSN